MTPDVDTKNRSQTILVVDDSLQNLKLLTEILSEEGYRVRPVEKSKVALESALAQPPDLILLDVKMPGMDGFEVCSRLKQDERTRELPIIFVSAAQDIQDRVRGFEVGGVDFISKPYQEAEILARVKTHLQLRDFQIDLETLVSDRTAELEIVHDELRLSEEKYRALAENATDGILVVQNGHRKYYNPCWLKITGYSQEEYEETTFLSLVHPDDMERTEAHYQSLVDGDNIGRAFELRIISKSGDLRWLSMRGSIIPWEGSPAGMVFIEDITERKQVVEQLLKYQERLKALASQLTLTEERERRRIAAELHDHVGQVLAVARIQLASVRKDVSDPDAIATMEDLSETLRQAIQDTRDLVFDLSSPLLNELGLTAALSEWVEEQYIKKYHTKTEFTHEGLPIQLDEDLQSILFRSVRELLMNVTKHADAKHVCVRLVSTEQNVMVSVKDDGIGCEVKLPPLQQDRTSGFGLFSIQERMRDLGGSMEIVSESGKGCEVILTIPLNNR